MIFLSNLQKETLFKVDKMIEENKTFDEIVWKLQEEKYYFKCFFKRKEKWYFKCFFGIIVRVKFKLLRFKMIEKEK